LLPMFFSPVGMVLVALGSVLYWKRRSEALLRWFWVGAGIWTVGVGLKVVWALLFNEPILRALESALPRAAYLVGGSLYIGVLTGIFEIGVTLAAVLIWKRLAREPGRAIAVGVGAGAFEALLLGLGVLAGLVVALSGGPGAEQARAALTRLAQVTPLLWLVGPVERVIAILCHTSSRALVLLGVARRRLRLFWWGFLIMTAIDSIAGFVHISGAIGKVSMWWAELALAPFAIVSVPIILWCLRNWPPESTPAKPDLSDAVPGGGTAQTDA